MTTAMATSGQRRLEQLYEVSKLFTAFTNVDDTVGQALLAVAATLPLESALLIQATIACHTEITVWRCEDSAPARLREARNHAEAVYAYLVGARSVDTLDLHDRIASATLPVPRGRRVSSEPTRRFVTIPLVVARGVVFGALQLEAACDLDRSDVEFVNALANELAIALDRERIRRHDVVRRREAELSQARYEGLVDHIDAAFLWEADLETQRISYVSAQFERLLGFSRRQCLDDRNWWRSHVHPDDRGLLEQTFARALDEPGGSRCDHRVVASDHSIRWLHTTVHVADVPGEAPRFQGMSCDITSARIEHQGIHKHFLLDAGVTLGASLESAEVRQAIARLGVLQLGEVCLVDVVAEDGEPRRVAWAHRDEAAQRELDRMFGGTPAAQLLWTLVLDVISHARSTFVSIPAGVRCSSAEMAVAQHLGIRSALIVPFLLGTRRLGALTLGWLDDRARDDREVDLAEQLARRCALALDRARLYDHALRAVALREQALAVVSHELTSPLATIALAVESLGGDELPTIAPAVRTVAVAAIRSAADRMQRLGRDLLDVASIDAGGCAIVASPQDVAAIITESTESFEQAAAKRGVKLVGETPVGMPLVRCDRGRVLQVIANLLSNALNFVNPGGSVSLGVKQRENEAVFSVADTGSGIALEQHARLFERYWRGPQSTYPGLGLGLAIARSLVEGHGGRIWADSEPGQGATFFFTIPLAASPLGRSARPNRRSTRPRKS